MTEYDKSTSKQKQAQISWPITGDTVDMAKLGQHEQRPRGFAGDAHRAVPRTRTSALSVSRQCASVTRGIPASIAQESELPVLVKSMRSNPVSSSDI
eukprot:6212016-Pleurochrysis_carterae.AAC.1